MKLREKDRVSVNLNCNFERDAKRFSGRVTNMSRNGLLTIWNSDDTGAANLSKGEAWTVEVELPAFHSFPPNAFLCQAVIVRIGAGRRNKQEVAFRIDRMTAATLKIQSAKTASRVM